MRINTMAGKLYAVGVGPGDPELITIKALKIIKNTDCIACPECHGEPRNSKEMIVTIRYLNGAYRNTQDEIMH